jgi:hypothetical protein
MKTQFLHGNSAKILKQYKGMILRKIYFLGINLDLNDENSVFTWKFS